jgi:hypothetical protein
MLGVATCHLVGVVAHGYLDSATIAGAMTPTSAGGGSRWRLRRGSRRPSTNIPDQYPGSKIRVRVADPSVSDPK